MALSAAQIAVIVQEFQRHIGKIPPLTSIEVQESLAQFKAFLATVT